MATLSPAASPTLVPRRHKRRIWISFAIGFLIGVAIGFYFISANWQYRYRKIRPMLEDDLASQIEVKSYHRTYFFNPGFVATWLTLPRLPDSSGIGRFYLNPGPESPAGRRRRIR
jgi:hypothetical protein